MTLQSIVGEWHRKTFGPTTPHLLRAMRDKLKEEVGEADAALGLNDSQAPWGIQGIAAEMADVLIVLLALADRMGLDLLDEATEKLGALRLRRYAGAAEGYRRL